MAIKPAGYGYKPAGCGERGEIMPYCHLCSKDFHYLGIARHRAKHRDAKEDCLITYSDGKTYRYNYSEKVEARTKGIKDEG